MSDTTIRVDSAVRDKLRALADEDHVTLGDLLSRLAEREQYQREMRRANEVMDRMRGEDPAAWQEYLSELGAFEAGTARDGLTAATSDWPEYNDAGSAAGARPGRRRAACRPGSGGGPRARRQASRTGISGLSYNELRNEQLIVAAITSRQRGLPFHIPVGAGCGLRMPSWVQSESVRAISAQRVIRPLGRARPETVAEVRNRVISFLRDW